MSFKEGFMEPNEDPIKRLKELYKKEPFKDLMGIKVLDIGPGYALVEAQVRQSFLNIHGITHGGALFSLVDEAFELASNSHGTISVALNMSITFFNATSVGDILRAEAKEIFKTNRTATYQIQVHDQNNKPIATCQALVYRKKDPLPEA